MVYIYIIDGNGCTLMSALANIFRPKPHGSLRDAMAKPTDIKDARVRVRGLGLELG